MGLEMSAESINGMIKTLLDDMELPDHDRITIKSIKNSFEKFGVLTPQQQKLLRKIFIR